jgi:hypothetical protein
LLIIKFKFGEFNRRTTQVKIFPLGLIDFRLLVDKPGDRAKVTVFFSDGSLQDGIWHKYDPVERI